MSTILLIRHGESESNAGLPTTHPERVELTGLGIEQAQYIAEYLKSQVSPDLIVTSTYQRAKQTAELTKSLFPGIPVKVWPVHEFTYLSMWHKENSTIDERRKSVEVYWDFSEPSYVNGQGSESFEQFIGRVRDVIKCLKEADYNTIAIFSHEQFIRAVLWLLEGDPGELDSKSMRHFRDLLQSGSLPNGAILRTQFDDSRDYWQWELITSHLDKRELAAAGVHAQK